MRRYLGIATALMALALPAFGADDIAAQLAAKLGVSSKDVTPGPIPGFYSVVLGPQVVYVTTDGRYLLRGDILDRTDGKNLSAGQRDAARLAYIASIGEQDMILFAPPHPKHVLTVLTDIDCGYCRQLAEDMPQLLSMGVELRYIAFPRTGVGSPSWDKAMAVWCAKNRQVAYQYAMRGADIAAGKCDPAPVLAGYEFAQKLGVDGTPVIIDEYGQMIDGYLPPDQLVKLLDEQSPPTGQPY